MEFTRPDNQLVLLMKTKLWKRQFESDMGGRISWGVVEPNNEVRTCLQL